VGRRGGAADGTYIIARSHGLDVNNGDSRAIMKFRCRVQGAIIFFALGTLEYLVGFYPAKPALAHFFAILRNRFFFLLTCLLFPNKILRLFPKPLVFSFPTR
jgi:hypothetical protein